MIYFIQNTNTGSVKIGYSKNPDVRTRPFQTGHEHALRVLAVIPGDKSHEGRLHRRFAAYHVRGEWFRGDKEFLDAVARIVRASWTLPEHVGRTEANPGIRPSMAKVHPEPSNDVRQEFAMPRAPTVDSFKQGGLVVHPQYGIGRVLAIRETTEEDRGFERGHHKIKIQFTQWGEKIFLLEKSPLRPVVSEAEKMEVTEALP